METGHLLLPLTAQSDVLGAGSSHAKPLISALATDYVYALVPSLASRGLLLCAMLFGPRLAPIADSDWLLRSQWCHIAPPAYR
jgi:hypothetical protein